MIAFQPNCTLPPDGVSYVASPTTRSTLDILWTSLATIFACTYSVLHLNVPEQRRGRDPGWMGDIKWSLHRFRETFKWCIITLLMPELVLTLAVINGINAWKQLRLLHRDLPLTSKTVGLTHMLFADMGGFVLGYRSDSAASATGPRSHGTPPDASDPEQMPLAKASENAGHSISLESRGAGNEQQPSGVPRGDSASKDAPVKLWHLDAYILRNLVLEGHISAAELPFAEEITDRSRSDTWTKAITLLQICYFVLAVLVRLNHRLPISELELGTAAFVVCSALTYLVTFPKPKAPETPIMLCAAASQEIMDATRRHAKLSPEDGFWSAGQECAAIGYPPPNDVVRETEDEGLLSWLLSLVATTVFSAIHVGGWNLSFPSVVDMWIWRASAIATTAAPLFVLVCIVGQDFIGQRRWLQWPIACGLVLVCGSYCAARLALVVEMFRGLGFLPPEAYAATWTTNVPHIG